MSPAELENYLHHQLPLSKVMQVSVLNLSTDSVVLSAPLEPNINHCGTVFGGSAFRMAESLIYTGKLFHLLNSTQFKLPAYMVYQL